MKQPGGMLAYVVASAYLKGLINKIFTEAAVGSNSQVNLVKYTVLEEAVAPPFGSESGWINVNQLTDKQRFQLVDIGGGDNPGAAVSFLYRALSRMEFPMVKLDDGVEQFMFDQTFTTSPIRKQDRSWFGQIFLMSEKTVARYEALAFNALHAALEALSERFGLARVPVMIAGESGEKKALRLQRRAEWDAELRKRFFLAVVDWVHETDSEKKEQLWLKLSGQWTDLERNDEIGTTSRLYSTKQTSDLTAYDVPMPKRKLQLADTVHLGLGALKNLGKAIKIKKKEIEKNEISNMGDFSRQDAVRFCEYAIYDSVITAEGIIWAGDTFQREIGSDKLRFRMAGYTSAFFKNRFAEIYNDERVRQSGFPVGDLRTYLGWEKPEKTGPRNPRYKCSVEPDDWAPLIHQAYMEERAKPNGWQLTLQHAGFSRFYCGGWNSVFQAGAFGPSIYWDQTSAYLVALMMLKFDYMFNFPLIFRGEEAERVVQQMLPDGAGQIAGVMCSFEFETAVERNGRIIPVEPIFPVKLEPIDISAQFEDAGETILHPRCGLTCVSWPEFYAAVMMGILKHVRVHSVETYARLDGPSPFDGIISEVLALRGEPGKKDAYKALLAFAYGKLAMGIKYTVKGLHDGTIEKKATPPGGISNFPLAAFCTSHCRAVNGELLYYNEPNTCLGITTDGYITTQTMDLVLGNVGLNADNRIKKIYNSAKGCHYKFFNTSYIATETMAMRTRCYVLDGIDEDGKPATKLSRGGIQTHADGPKNPGDRDERVIEFMRAASVGGFLKESWLDFPKMQSRGGIPPRKEKTIARCSMSYDMKRIPLLPVETSVFTYKGETLELPKFNTRPLHDKYEYIAARQVMQKNMTVDEYKKVILKHFPS